MSGKGNCYDNSAVDSFFKSLKAELVWSRNRHTRREVEVALFEYINGFYNPRRKHSALGWNHPWPSNRGPLNMSTRPEQNRCRSKPCHCRLGRG